MEIAHIRYCHV